MIKGYLEVYRDSRYVRVVGAYVFFQIVFLCVLITFRNRGISPSRFLVEVVDLLFRLVGSDNRMLGKKNLDVGGRGRPSGASAFFCRVSSTESVGGRVNICPLGVLFLLLAIFLDRISSPFSAIAIAMKYE